MIDSLLDIIRLTLQVSGTALILSTLVGIPLGVWLGQKRFRFRRLLVAMVYTGMGFPPVVIGLFVYLMLSNNGPLAGLDLSFLPRLFTPSAMVLAQIILAMPLVTGFTMTAVMSVDPRLPQQIEALGATRRQIAWTLLMEARLGVLTAIAAGFGAIISEVGAVMLVGGNIEGATRVLTTAIVLETRKGNFNLALSLGAVLLALSFLANSLVLRFQGRTIEG